jgi:hypothetical protein
MPSINTEHDLGQLLTQREQINVFETLPIATKTGLSLTTLMTLPDKKGDRMRKGNLRIICADNDMYSLEEMRVIMLNLGVLA